MTAMNELRHVVVLMLENQSFDHLLGFLQLADPTQQVVGLTGNESVPSNPSVPGDVIPVSKATTRDAYITDPSPGHEFEDVNQQLFGERQPGAFPAMPPMNGFVANYAEQPGHDGRPIGPGRGRGIMRCLDSSLIPVISTLARNFVVCDHWHASVPGPTWPNRFFVHAATSNGLSESPKNPDVIASQFWGSQFRMRTIYEELMDHGYTWKIYFDDHPQSFALRNLHPYAGDLFCRMEVFAQDVQNATLPNYAFLEPQYFGALGNPANDQHPPHSLIEGERLIASVYDTLRSREDLWQHTLFVLLYDEHGGFYDHVPPPTAVPPDPVSANGAKFKFDRLGLRVPALLISPWVGKGRVDHAVYDHSSLLASVKKLFNLPSFLTARDTQAHTFEGNFLAVARPTVDTPQNLAALVRRVPVAATPPDDRGLTDNQQALLALARALQTPQSEHDAAAQVDALTRQFRGEVESP